MKGGQKEGRKGKRDRIGEGFAEGRRVETQEEHDDHRGVNRTNSNQIIKFNNILLFLQFPFYRINGEVTRKRRLATLVPRQLTFVQREDETNEIIFLMTFRRQI